MAQVAYVGGNDVCREGEAWLVERLYTSTKHWWGVEATPAGSSGYMER